MLFFSHLFPLDWHDSDSNHLYIYGFICLIQSYYTHFVTCTTYSKYKLWPQMNYLWLPLLTGKLKSISMMEIDGKMGSKSKIVRYYYTFKRYLTLQKVLSAVLLAVANCWNGEGGLFSKSVVTVFKKIKPGGSYCNYQKTKIDTETCMCSTLSQWNKLVYTKVL